MKRMVLMVVATAFTAVSASDDNAWHVLPIYGGGYVQNVVISPSATNVWYSYVDVGGPYRSDDAGGHWRPLHGNLSACYRDVEGDCVRTLSVDPRNADSFVMVSGGTFENPAGVFVSRDGGRSFRRTGFGRFYGNGRCRNLGHCLVRDPADPDHLFCGEDWDGVQVSTDNGETWRGTGFLEGTFITDLRYDATVKGRLYACAGRPPASGDRTYVEGLFRSDDNGVTWRKVCDEAPYEICQVKGCAEIVGFFPGANEMRVSSDGGATWRFHGEGLPVREDRISHAVKGNFYAFAAGPDFMLAGDAAGTIFRCPVGGTVWTEVPHESTKAAVPENEPRMTWITNGRMQALNTLIVDPADSAHWLATDWYEIWESHDAGRNWTTRIQGIMQLVSFTVEFDPFSSSNIVYGVADMGLYMSKDGGRRFHPPNGWIYACTASYSRKTSGLMLMCGGKGPSMVKRSRSAGRWWEDPALRGLPKLDGSDPKIRAYTVAANPAAEEFYICLSGPVGPGRGGIYRTCNAGDDWEWFGQGLPEGASLFKGGEWEDGVFPQLYFGVDGSAICHSAKLWKQWYLDRENGTWKPVSGSCSGIVSADPFRPGRFLGHGKVMCESLDGGRTWHPFPVPVGRTNFVSFDAQVKDQLVVGLPDRTCAVSRDGGRHFTVVPGSDKVPTGCSSKVLIDRSRVYMLSTGSGVWTYDCSEVVK